MPRNPPTRTPEEEALEWQARCLQFHDPDEIRARYWHTNMRICRVMFSILWGVAALIAYYSAPFLLRVENWPVVSWACWFGAQAIWHLLAVFGAGCFVTYCVGGLQFFKELDT